MRPISCIYQIEITTRCNLRCKYCPHPQLERPKVDMEWETFEAALDLVRYYCRIGSQGELSLTGLGEGVLHPRFSEMLARAREVIGPNRKLVFATNGIDLTDELCAEIAPYRPMAFISLHRPEKAGPAVEAARKHGILAGVNASPATSAYDWAGQVKWFNSGPQLTCPYLIGGWGVVLVDGKISTCCWDAHGKNIIGTVLDKPDAIMMQTFPLCDQCHHTIPKDYTRETL